MSAYPNLDKLEQSLQALRDENLALDAFCRTWRSQPALQQLPVRYGEVLEDLLSRLETGSQFAQESCSYSQEELLSNLADWLAKAQRVLPAHSVSTG